MELLEPHRGKLTLVLLVALVVGVAIWWDRRPSGRELAVTAASAPAQTAQTAQGWLTVDVAGAVSRPGIYSLPSGSRVADVIDAAGGVTSEADLTRLNRAAKLRDEQQVIVPRRLPTPPPALAQAAVTAGQPTVLNLNTASAAELEKLPGIGAVTAQRIIDYRGQFGPFANVEQLREAKLVNASTFDKIKEAISAP